MIHQVVKNLADLYELTPLQEDILNHYRRTPGAGFFHEDLIFEFKGRIDPELFKRCWERLVERHDIIRTSFHHQDLSKPLQVVHHRVELPWELMDWTDLAQAEADLEFQTLMKRDLSTDYLLEKAPLMRWTLIRRPDDNYLFWWRFHHILLDGWSFMIVLNEFLQYYRSYCLYQRGPELSPGHPFKGYVHWVKHRETVADQAFWKSYLKKELIESNRLDKKSKQSSTDAIRQGRIDEDIAVYYEAVQNLAKAHQLTLNTLFQGIFIMVVSAYFGGEGEPVIGIRAVDRSAGLQDAQQRVGVMFNMLPFIFSIEPEAKFVEWAKKLQLFTSEVMTHGAVSEKDIRGWLEIPETRGLFDMALIFKNMPQTADYFAGLDFTMTGYNMESRPQYPVNVFIWPYEMMDLKIIYDRHYLSHEEASDILQKIKQSLAMIIDRPESSCAAMMEQLNTKDRKIRSEAG